MNEDVGRPVVRGASRDVLGWGQRAWLGRRWLHHGDRHVGCHSSLGWGGVTFCFTGRSCTQGLYARDRAQMSIYSFVS